MPAKPGTARQASKDSPRKGKTATTGGILLRYRDADTPYGVTRKTASELAQTLGLSETQVIHAALAQFARQNLPRYEADTGPLTTEQQEAVRQLQPTGRMKTKESLF